MAELSAAGRCSSATLSDVFGLPEETNLSEFVGCHLEVVSVSLHQIKLGFDGLRNLGISVEGDYSVLRSGGDEALYSAAPEGADALIALVGAEVVAAVVTEPGTTTIKFVGGAAVAIYDSEAHYESYQIHIGERLIVV